MLEVHLLAHWAIMFDTMTVRMNVGGFVKFEGVY